ncbi:MAG: TetR family transcriptional regulator [Acidimicrobiia bacterium]
MPPKRLTRDEKKARTRQLLLDAAAKLFERQGFAATSLEQVAEEGGVTKGAVYAHFEDKVDLFLSFVDAHSVVMDPNLTTDGSATLEEDLRRLGRDAAAQIPREPRGTAFGLELKAFALRNPRARRESAARIRGIMEGLLVSRGTEPPDGEHFTPTDLPLQLSVIGQALIEGLSQLRAFDPELVPDETFELAFSLLARAVPDDQVTPGGSPETRAPR